jgi:hypothetical protein
MPILREADSTIRHRPTNYGLLTLPSLRCCVRHRGHLGKDSHRVYKVISSMPIVKMFFQETMLRYNVCFLQANTLIGTHWEFTDAEKVIGLMESANCRFRDIQLVRQTLKERRPGSIDIELTQEQFDSLKSRKQRVQRKH